jgi:hypothetical protein
LDDLTTFVSGVTKTQSPLTLSSSLLSSSTNLSIVSEEAACLDILQLHYGSYNRRHTNITLSLTNMRKFPQFYPRFFLFFFADLTLISIIVSQSLMTLFLMS